MAQAVSSAFHRTDPCSIPGQSTWHLWCTKWQWDRFFSQHFVFALSVSFRHCCILVVGYMLLSPEGQMVQAWKLLRKQCSFGNRAAVGKKVLSLLFFFGGSIGAVCFEKKQWLNFSRSYFSSVQYGVSIPLPQKPNTRPCIEQYVFSPHSSTLCLFI